MGLNEKESQLFKLGKVVPHGDGAAIEFGQLNFDEFSTPGAWEGVRHEAIVEHAGNVLGKKFDDVVIRSSADPENGFLASAAISSAPAASAEQTESAPVDEVHEHMAPPPPYDYGEAPSAATTPTEAAKSRFTQDKENIAEKALPPGYQQGDVGMMGMLANGVYSIAAAPIKVVSNIGGWINGRPDAVLAKAEAQSGNLVAAAEAFKGGVAENAFVLARNRGWDGAAVAEFEQAISDPSARKQWEDMKSGLTGVSSLWKKAAKLNKGSQGMQDSFDKWAGKLDRALGDIPDAIENGEVRKTMKDRLHKMAEAVKKIINKFLEVVGLKDKNKNTPAP